MSYKNYKNLIILKLKLRGLLKIFVFFKEKTRNLFFRTVVTAASIQTIACFFRNLISHYWRNFRNPLLICRLLYQSLITIFTVSRLTMTTLPLRFENTNLPAVGGDEQQTYPFSWIRLSQLYRLITNNNYFFRWESIETEYPTLVDYVNQQLPFYLSHNMVTLPNMDKIGITPALLKQLDLLLLEEFNYFIIEQTQKDPYLLFRIFFDEAFRDLVWKQFFDDHFFFLLSKHTTYDFLLKYNNPVFAEDEVSLTWVETIREMLYIPSIQDTFYFLFIERFGVSWYWDSVFSKAVFNFGLDPVLTAWGVPSFLDYPQELFVCVLAITGGLWYYFYSKCEAIVVHNEYQYVYNGQVPEPKTTIGQRLKRWFVLKFLRFCTVSFNLKYPHQLNLLYTPQSFELRRIFLVRSPFREIDPFRDIDIFFTMFWLILYIRGADFMRMGYTKYDFGRVVRKFRLKSQYAEEQIYLTTLSPVLTLTELVPFRRTKTGFLPIRKRLDFERSEFGERKRTYLFNHYNSRRILQNGAKVERFINRLFIAKRGFKKRKRKWKKLFRRFFFLKNKKWRYRKLSTWLSKYRGHKRSYLRKKRIFSTGNLRRRRWRKTLRIFFFLLQRKAQSRTWNNLTIINRHTFLPRPDTSLALRHIRLSRKRPGYSKYLRTRHLSFLLRHSKLHKTFRSRRYRKLHILRLKKRPRFYTGYIRPGPGEHLDVYSFYNAHNNWSFAEVFDYDSFFDNFSHFYQTCSDALTVLKITFNDFIDVANIIQRFAGSTYFISNFQHFISVPDIDSYTMDLVAGESWVNISRRNVDLNENLNEHLRQQMTNYAIASQKTNSLDYRIRALFQRQPLRFFTFYQKNRKPLHLLHNKQLPVNINSAVIAISRATPASRQLKTSYVPYLMRSLLVFNNLIDRKTFLSFRIARFGVLSKILRRRRKKKKAYGRRSDSKLMKKRLLKNVRLSKTLKFQKHLALGRTRRRQKGKVAHFRRLFKRHRFFRVHLKDRFSFFRRRRSRRINYLLQTKHYSLYRDENAKTRQFGALTSFFTINKIPAKTAKSQRALFRHLLLKLPSRRQGNKRLLLQRLSKEKLLYRMSSFSHRKWRRFLKLAKHPLLRKRRNSRRAYRRNPHKLRNFRRKKKLRKRKRFRQFRRWQLLSNKISHRRFKSAKWWQFKFGLRRPLTLSTASTRIRYKPSSSAVINQPKITDNSLVQFRKNMRLDYYRHFEGQVQPLFLKNEFKGFFRNVLQATKKINNESAWVPEKGLFRDEPKMVNLKLKPELDISENDEDDLVRSQIGRRRNQKLNVLSNRRFFYKKKKELLRNLRLTLTRKYISKHSFFLHTLLQKTKKLPPSYFKQLLFLRLKIKNIQAMSFFRNNRKNWKKWYNAKQYKKFKPVSINFFPVLKALQKIKKSNTFFHNNKMLQQLLGKDKYIHPIYRASLYNFVKIDELLSKFRPTQRKTPRRWIINYYTKRYCKNVFRAFLNQTNQMDVPSTIDLNMGFGFPRQMIIYKMAPIRLSLIDDKVPLLWNEFSSGARFVNRKNFFNLIKPFGRPAVVYTNSDHPLDLDVSVKAIIPSSSFFFGRRSRSLLLWSRTLRYPRNRRGRLFNFFLTRIKKRFHKTLNTAPIYPYRFTKNLPAVPIKRFYKTAFYNTNISEKTRQERFDEFLQDWNNVYHQSSQSFIDNQFLGDLKQYTGHMRMSKVLRHSDLIVLAETFHNETNVAKLFPLYAAPWRFGTRHKFIYRYPNTIKMLRHFSKLIKLEDLLSNQFNVDNAARAFKVLKKKHRRRRRKRLHLRKRKKSIKTRKAFLRRKKAAFFKNLHQKTF